MPCQKLLFHSVKLVLTCEHAGNTIPQEYGFLFRGEVELLDSHRGFDPGAYDLFNELSVLSQFNKYQLVSRLLVELNRSVHHRDLFSEKIKEVPPHERKIILEKYYFPYRKVVEEQLDNFHKDGETILHLSIHTFTPNLLGKVRKADIGLLYDPKRTEEKEFCKSLKKMILLQNPQLNIRFNYPYRGTADGFTTFLRKKYRENYLGIELEVNQKFVTGNRMHPVVKRNIFCTLQKLL